MDLIGRSSKLVPIVLLLSITGCSTRPSDSTTKSRIKKRGGDSSQTSRSFSIVTTAGEIPDDAFEPNTISVLFIGNSHIMVSPNLLQALIQKNNLDKNVLIARASGGFLIQHARNPATIELLKAGAWDYVVLQAQKYSTSGNYHYSYDGALSLSKIANDLGSSIIMFPEWSRKGFPDEYKRIDKIHLEIAKITGATVAPIGSVWVKAESENPNVALLSADGNHASDFGHFLNACVFYSMITQKRANADQELLEFARIDADSAKRLESLAWKAVADSIAETEDSQTDGKK